MLGLWWTIFILLAVLTRAHSQQFPQYDRQDQYSQTNPQYPSDRNSQRPYDQGQQGSNSNQYGQGQYYGPDRYPGPGQNPYDRDRDRDRDRNNQYGQSSTDQYGRDQYGQRNPQDQYGQRGPQDQYNRNQDQYGSRGNQDQYGQRGPQDQYNRNQDQYGSRGNQDQYGQRGNQDQYGRNSDQYGQRDQYGRNPDQYGQRGQQGQFGRDDGSDPYGGRGEYDSNYGEPLTGLDSNCCEDYCYKRDANPYVQFATKTAYQFVFGKQARDHDIPLCKPIQIWSLNRNGVNYPDRQKLERLRNLSKLKEQIIRNYEEKRSQPEKGKLCEDDLYMLKMWRWNETITPDRANFLSPQGSTDIRFLARRSLTRFSELLRVPYSNAHYNFRYADNDKSHDSYQAYIEGLFERQAYLAHATLRMDDQMINPEQNCRRWRENYDREFETQSEYERFKQRPDYRELVRNVFRRLGFRYTLDDRIIEDMYDMCRYEKAWNINTHSPWCTVFTKDQLKILEYAEDLYYYYYSGYGREASKHIGCSPLKDLYEQFERTVNSDGIGNTEPKVSVYFTDETPLQTLIVALGIYKDESRLTAENYYQQNTRQWRLSKLSPFSANLAAILYQCEQGDRYRVMFFLNENRVDFPQCQVGLCSWNVFRDTVRTTVENCNADYCERGGSQSLRSTSSVLGTVVLAFVCKMLML